MSKCLPNREYCVVMVCLFTSQVTSFSQAKLPSYLLLTMSHCVLVKWHESKSASVYASLFMYSMHIFIYYSSSNLNCVFNLQSCVLAETGGICVLHLYSHIHEWYSHILLAVGNIRICVLLHLQLHKYLNKLLATREY